MRKIAVLLVVCIFLVAVCPMCSFASGFISQIADKINSGQGQGSAKESLIKADDFFYNFNFYAALLNTGHSLSLDNVDEISRLTDSVLYKTIFNKCEILSLDLSTDATEIQSVHCTWAKDMPCSQTHLKDFLVLLMESLLACGFEENTAKEIFDYLGGSSEFNIGDSNETTIDGIKVGYKVERGIGVSFKIERG